MRVRASLIAFFLFAVPQLAIAEDSLTNDPEKNISVFGSDAIDNDKISVSPVEGGIEINLPDDLKMTFYIFSITGQMIKKVDAVGYGNRVDLTKGCYIVKSDKSSKKVVVR